MQHHRGGCTHHFGNQARCHKEPIWVLSEKLWDSSSPRQELQWRWCPDCYEERGSDWWSTQVPLKASAGGEIIWTRIACTKSNPLCVPTTWAEAFLIGKTQSVLVYGIRSKEEDVHSGVPHGTVLGPLMFLLYINDLPAHMDQRSSCRLFADDCLLYRPVESIEDQVHLQRDLRNLAMGVWVGHGLQPVEMLCHDCKQRPNTSTLPLRAMWNHLAISRQWEVSRSHAHQWPVMVPTHQ